MAAVVYPLFKEALLARAIDTDLTSEDVKVMLIDTADHPYSAADQFLDDITGAAIEATTGNLASKSVTNGVFDAADIAFSAVSGDTCEALIGYIDTAVAGTSRLVWFDDGSTGLPITPNGEDINITWDDGASKIFAL